VNAGSAAPGIVIAESPAGDGPDSILIAARQYKLEPLSLTSSERAKRAPATTAYALLATVPLVLDGAVKLLLVSVAVAVTVCSVVGSR
jgi:hypothetical protein